MNLNDISTQMIYTTVPIYAVKQDGKISTGTGFIFSIKDKTDNTFMPFLITNYHVLDGSINGFIDFHVGDTVQGTPKDEIVHVRFDNQALDSNRLGKLDLVAIPLAATMEAFRSKGVSFFFRSVEPTMIPTEDQERDLAAIEDITFIGYPKAIIDTKHNFPIIRKGITATPIWNSFGGQDAFLIDAGVYPGSSGSPVFVFNQGSYPTKTGIAIGNRLMFVGVISGTYKTDENGYINLGVVINSRAFYKELSAFVSRLLSKQTI